MPKFIIRDRQACWVTFITIIEAEDDTEAYALWCDGDLGVTTRAVRSCTAQKNG